MQEFKVSVSPHIKDKENVASAMKDVVISLLPMVIASLIIYKKSALLLYVICIITAYVSQAIMRIILGKGLSTRNASVLVTALILALCLPSGINWWIAVLATFFAVAVAKELVGGIGWNIFNPAAFGKVVSILFAPVIAGLSTALYKTGKCVTSVDAITKSTPLAYAKFNTFESVRNGMANNIIPGFKALILGTPTGGALVEASLIALLIGAIYLLYKKHISLHTPISIILRMFVLALAYTKSPFFAFFHIITGGLLFGAFFMATDWVTSPITNKGKIVFGICIGILVFVFRFFLAPTEGMAFSIIIMNVFVGLIDRTFPSKKFGT